MVGRFCLVTAYLWIMYRLKEDKGQLFGFYQPWLHEHEHAHLHYVEDGSHDSLPELIEHHEEEEDDQEDATEAEDEEDSSEDSEDL